MVRTLLQNYIVDNMGIKKHNGKPIKAQYFLSSIEIGDRFVKISNTLSNTKLG
jgi:hypothetical protein